MSTLVILLPARPRGDASGTAAAPGAGTEYSYVLSADGLSIAAQGRANLSLLPRAVNRVAVVHDLDLGWQRLALPKAPASRLRAALVGMLEEQLLDEAQQTHFALAPGAAAGQMSWVAVVHKPWLAAHLAHLEHDGQNVDRVLPASAPDDVPTGHFFAASDMADGSQAQTWLVLSDANGVQCINLAGGMARGLIPAWTARGTRWSAAPAVAAQAERWLGAPLRVQGDADRGLQATRSLCNLRQFDLSAHHRGLRALREWVKHMRSPSWRAARLGLVGLLAVQVLGLNFWAWRQGQAVAQRQQAMDELLRSSFPAVRAVLDAPVQMRRETERLQAFSGQASESDLEPLLVAAARAWPPGQSPLESLRYEPGRLVLSARGWAAAHSAEFADRLRAAGWALESADGRMTISRRADARRGP